MNKLQKNYKQAMLHKIACLLLLVLGVINTAKGQENTFTDEQFVYELSLNTATPKGEKPDKPTPPAIGDTLVENGLRYQITSASTATLLGPDFNQDLADWPVKDCKIKTDIAVNGNVFHVTAIAPNAFSGATQLTSILISGNIETIGLEAFYRCYSLTSLSIPASVKSIENEEDEPFFTKLDLHSIVVEQGNTVYASENGILYDKQKKTLLHCPTLYANPIRIPSTVTTIRPYAFDWCEEITTLTFPEGVTTVGECALNGCKSLTKLYLPASIRKIDLLADDSDNALSALKQIHCAQADPSLIALAPGVFDYIDCSACTLYVPKGAKSKYAAAPEWKRFTTIIEEGDEEELPENIPTVGISISREAVVMYVGEEVELTASVVPDNATEQGVIWEYSNPALIKKTAKGILALAPGELLITVRTENRKFSTQCEVTILQKAIEPAIGDTLVENGLRYQITSASTATLLGPDFNQDLADWPVKDCKIKTDIAVNGNVFHVTAIAPNAFSGATQLTSILISGNIETIGLEAFYRCYSLTSLSIPASVKSIENEEDEPFFTKLDLHSIVVEQGNTVYASENGILYDKQKKTLLHCPTLYANPIRIPSTVTTIRPYAFDWCEEITTLTFPEGVTTVGECALNGCKSLTKLYLPASIRKIDLLADDSDNALSALKQIHCAQADPSLIALAPGVFDYIDCSACTLYVPKGAKSKYAAAPEWKRFTTIIEEGDEEELPENIPTVGISISREAVVMYVGEEVELTASVVPDNATEQGVIWEYSNPALIKKTAKGILALAPGELLITVRTENRKFSTQCGVTILQKAIEPEIENKTDNSVTVSWEQVEEADKYLLNVYSDSGKKDLFAQYKFDASGSLLKSSLFFSHTITGLVPGTTFYIETIAYKTISDRYIPVAQNTITVQTSGTSTAIESIARETQLAIQEGRVTIYPYEPINIAVISINGKYIFNGKINEVTTIPVPLPGIYIVTFIKDGKNISRKIIVP